MSVHTADAHGAEGRVIVLKVIKPWKYVVVWLLGVISASLITFLRFYFSAEPGSSTPSTKARSPEERDSWMTNDPHNMTPQQISDALQILEEARLQALKTDAHRSSDRVEAALNSVHDVQNALEQAKTATRKQTRWRWIAAVGSLLAAVGLIWLSTRLDKGFWQLSAELIGGALITYVVIERGVSALVAIPAREVKKLNDSVEEAIKATENAVTLSRNLVQHVEGLVKLGD